DRGPSQPFGAPRVVGFTISLRTPGLRTPGLRTPGLRTPGLRTPGLRTLVTRFEPTIGGVCRQCLPIMPLGHKRQALSAIRLKCNVKCMTDHQLVQTRMSSDAVEQLDADRAVLGLRTRSAAVRE